MHLLIKSVYKYIIIFVRKSFVLSLNLKKNQNIVLDCKICFGWLDTSLYLHCINYSKNNKYEIDDEINQNVLIAT